ncbi:hypothetical protein [Endozoicomonas numazuensis]|uniref:Lipoprotein n=1 Tax=Endozoicomonas numazuensis TaxID=1137799 RepID=A0A081NHY7_9GAMM|nr:hypothetical protein [Endozoicomonas numazuensis]KEQ18060.1 hypothetical protein GZ78_10800 [Endozoicomonas numazuensis]
MYRLLLSVLIPLLSGCASPIASNLDGKCYELVSDQQLWKTYDNGYVGAYMIAGNEKFQLTDERAPTELVQKGSRVVVSQVLTGFDGSWGEFLRIQIKVLDGEAKGVIADIPACVPYHPRPPWLIKGCKSEAGDLKVKSEFLKEVKECYQ